MTPEQNLVGIETKLEKIKHDADDKVKKVQASMMLTNFQMSLSGQTLESSFDRFRANAGEFRGSFV